MRDTPPVTKNIIFINLILFLATSLNQNLMVSTFALFYPTSQFFHVWQIVTHMFMHGGFWHIFFNMYSLFIFGSVLENMIGQRKFLIFYCACGLGAMLLHTGVEAIQAAIYMNGIAEGSAKAAEAYYALKLTPTLGASGAIYGVLIGYAVLFPQARLTLLFPPVTMSAKTMVLVFAGIELFTGVLGTADGVAHFAHLGGMLIGFLLIMYWKKRRTLFSDRY